MLELEPDSFDAHIDLGVVLQRGGDLAAAAAAYRAALARKHDDPRALGNLGALLREMGELEEAASSSRPPHASSPMPHRMRSISL